MMPPCFRNTIQPHGTRDRLTVGVYFVVGWLWTKRRRSLPVGLLCLMLAIVLLRPHPKPHVLPQPVPVSVVMPAPAPLPPPIHDKDTLLQRAVKVANTNDWELYDESYAARYFTYNWSTDHQVLFYRYDEKIGDLLCRRNIRTGREISFPKISRLWDDGSTKQYREISPDSQWVLWEGDYHDTEYHGYYGAKLDGSHKFHFPFGEGDFTRSVRWLPTRHYLLECVTEYNEKTRADKVVRLAMHNAAKPHVDLPLSKDASEDYDGETRFLPGNRMLVFWGGYDNPQKPYIVDTYLRGSPPKLLQHRVLSIPAGDREDMSVSPQGDRIAWVISPSEKAWPSGQGRVQYKICISHIDGSDMHELGHLSFPANREDWGGPIYSLPPHRLQWLPSGRKISFICNDALYVLAVPSGRQNVGNAGNGEKGRK